MNITNYEKTTNEMAKVKLSVFIIDNQCLYRQAIRQVLKETMEVVGESEIMPTIWSTIESISPDIVMVDVGLPKLTGIDITRQIVTRCPGVRVVMLSSSPDDEQLFEAIKSGAVAFIGKDISGDKLIRTLQKVGKGECPINDSLLNRPHTAKKVLELFHDLSLLGNDIEPLMTPLSPREMEILAHIAEGNSNKRIAFSLGIGEQTIKNHITSIMRKLNANDRTHAVVLAIRKGWLKIEDILEIADGIDLQVSVGRDN